MPSIREQAVITLRVDGDGKVIGQLRNVQSATEKTFSATEKAMSAMERSITSGFRSMITQYAGFVAAWQAGTKVLSSGLEFNKFVENQTMSFTVMMKSASGAKKQMEELYNFAVNSPLTFKETAGSAKQLMAYGFAAKELIPTMKSLGAVAIATGNRLDDIAYVYGTLRSQGRAYSRDLMQFGMRGIPIYEELAKVMGVSADQIQKLASQGKIGFKQVEQAFKNMTSEGGKFAGIIDGYMQTLTGKLSMFGDIAEQTAGRLMEPATEEIKAAVDELTTIFQSADFQDFIAELAIGIGDAASALAGMLITLVKILPILSKIAAFVITISLLKLAKSALFGLPTVLTTAANLLKGMVVTSTSLGTAISGISSSFAIFEFQLASAMSVVLPMVAAFAAIAAALVISSNMATKMKQEADKNKKSDNPYVRQAQLGTDTAIQGFQAAYTGSTVKKTADDVQKIAKEYNLAEGAVASMYIKQGLMSQETWNQYINTKAAQKGLEEYAKVQEGIKHTALTMVQEQAKYLSGITGISSTIYEDIAKRGKDIGLQGAKDFIAAFASERQKEKDIFGIAYNTDMLKDSLQKEADGIMEALRTGYETPGLFSTQYNETLQARLLAVNKELDGLGKKSKDLYKSLKEVGMWWLPKDAAVAATVTALDDSALATEKALYNANAEIEARKAILEQNLAITAEMDNSAEKTALQIEYMNQLLEIDGKRKQIIEDIAKAQARQEGVAKYNEKVSGQAGFWDDIRARAGNTTGMASAGYTAAATIDGTEVGAGIGGGNPLNMAANAFGILVGSVESVSAVLNPLTTTFQAMLSVIQPLIDNVLQPVIDVFEQIGEAIGGILRPFLGLAKIVISLVYGSLAPFIGIIQLVASALTWFYDGVIVPVGNFIIDAINAVIKVLNRIPGVHIRLIDRLETSVAQLTKALNADRFNATMEYMIDKLNDLIDSQLSSAQDLYEVGAMSGAEYAKKVNELNTSRLSLEENLVDVNVAQLDSVNAIHDWLVKHGAFDSLEAILAKIATGNQTPDQNSALAQKIRDWQALLAISQRKLKNMDWWELNSDEAIVLKESIKSIKEMIAVWQKQLNPASLAVGTSRVPRDMLAQLHEDESVVPATFMDGIRSGELALTSGSKGMGGQSTNVYITVQGTVVAENDLADTVAESISRRRSRGILTV